jgi:hypothetical protein
MYSPKVQNNACVDNRDTTSNVIPLFCYDAIFGSMRILEFPKGSDYLYAHKAVNYFFMIKSIESYYFTKGTLREEVCLRLIKPTTQVYLGNVGLLVRLVRNNIQYSNQVFIQKPIPGSKLNKTHGSLE